MAKKNRSRQQDIEQRRQHVRATDSFSNPMARIGFGTPSMLEGTEYPITRLTRNYTLLQSLYRSHWIARRIIDTPAEDMCKNWVTYKSQIAPDLIDRLTKLERKTRVKTRFIEGLKWGRLFGGAAGVIMIDGHEGILDQPLDYDMIMPGSFCGLMIRDRWSGVSPVGQLITDHRDPDYGLPEYYTVTTDASETFKIHHSRILRFIGRDVPMWEKQAEVYWGVSEVEHIYDELKKRDNTSWNIANLVFRAYLVSMKMADLGQVLSIGDREAQKEIYNVVQAQNWLMSNFGILLMDKDDDFDTKAYSFSGLAEIQESFMYDIAGAAEIPVTKLYGRSPAGMNATGESDMQNYYDNLSMKQEADVGPLLDKLMPIMAISEFGYLPDDLDYTFNPVDSPTANKKAELGEKLSETVGKAFDRGLISQKVALKEYRQQSDITGLFTNITDEDIEKADDYTQLPDAEPRDDEVLI